jgi:undecaprenyl-diphosphatase
MHARTTPQNTTADTTEPYPGARLPLAWLSVAVAALAVFLCLVVLVERHLVLSDDRALELDVHRLFGRQDFPLFDAVSFIGGTTVHGLIVFVCAVWLFLRRYRWSAAFLLFSQIGAIIGQVVKNITARPRPHLFPGALHAGGYSYPSGHALSATLLYGALAYLVWVHFGRSRMVTSVVVLLTAWALLIGFSRIVLGVHYPSDVEGGVALGLAWLYGTIGFFGAAVRQGVRPRAKP